MADPPDSACTRVLAVTELVEAILLELPEQDLLLAQRVSKKIQRTIAESTPIQRKLFYDVDVGNMKEMDGPPDINPLLQKMFPKDCQLDVLTRRLPCRSWESKCVHLPMINLTKKIYELGNLGCAKEFDEAQSCEEASWRRMWASRPAMPVIPVWNYDCGDRLMAVRMDRLMDHLCDDELLDEMIVEANQRERAFWAAEQHVWDYDTEEDYDYDYGDESRDEYSDDSSD